MDLLLPAINSLLRKNNNSFALSLVPLKKVKIDLSLSLSILMRAEKEHKKTKGHLKNWYKTLSAIIQLINLGLLCNELQCQEICSVNSVQNLATPFWKKKKKANSQGTRAILSIWISRVWSYSCWLLGASYITQRNRGCRGSSPAQVEAGPQTLQIHGYMQFHKVKSIKPKPFPWQLYLLHDSILSSQQPHSERTLWGS